MGKINQQQHKLPKVYLKKFGYKTKKNEWKVSVGTVGTKEINQKSVNFFTTSLNHFDIETEQNDVVKVFEDKFNQLVEVHYNKIISRLHESKVIDEAIKDYLSQMVPNFIVRSDKIRGQVEALLDSPERDAFIQMLVESSALTPGVAMVDHTGMFEAYKKMKNTELINRILILLGNFLFLKIWGNEFLILTPPNDRQWWTCDNPVVAYDESEEKLFISKQMEFYMALTPQMLLYLHDAKSENTANPLRHLASNEFHEVGEETHDQIMKHIMINSSQDIILAGHYEDDYFL